MPELLSKIDLSANFVDSETGIECRYVQRTDDYFIIYVSSHTGCNQACRFCHLTQTGQTKMRDVTPFEYLAQVNKVLSYWKSTHYSKKDLLKKVHVNFMARGEPLLNIELCRNFKEISYFMTSMISEATGCNNVKYKISTIFPQDATTYLGRYSSIFNTGADIYYSLYSLEDDFRKRWLPKAANPLLASTVLNGSPLTIHYALIEGQNDSLENANNIIDFVKSRFKQKPKLNIVRYNPYSPAQGIEPDEDVIEQHVYHMQSSGAFSRVKLVPRVGTDVYASCGTFFNNT